MSVVTRLFKNEDLQQIDNFLILYEQLGYPTTKEELLGRLEKLNKHDDYYMLLLINGKGDIIGFSGMCRMMNFEKSGAYLRILAFVVNSHYRKQGNGTLLLNESERLAHQLNCEALALNSGNREERLNAHAFYQANGFNKKSLGFVKQL
jgi:GNAT superfamily N-acetyltransferase